jgi:hypothetical protein
MIQANILDLIQKHGITFPDDVIEKITTLNEKLWKQSQLVTAALIRALIQDFYGHKKSQSISLENLGWRNKHRIRLLSDGKLSQRTMYKEWGVIDLLVLSDFLEKRKATSTWGNQEFHYRLNLDFLPEAPTLLESLRLFIEGSSE